MEFSSVPWLAVFLTCEGWECDGGCQLLTGDLFSRSHSAEVWEMKGRAADGCFLLISSYRQDQPERENVRREKSGSIWTHWIIGLCQQASNQMCMACGEQCFISHRGKAVRSRPKKGILFATISQHFLEGTHLLTSPVPEKHALEGSGPKLWLASSFLIQ